MDYNHKEIEKKWQNYWDEKQSFKAVTGDNYTRASNEQLKTIIDNAVAGLKCNDNVNNSAFNKLVEILAKKKILLKSEVNAIINS